MEVKSTGIAIGKNCGNTFRPQNTGLFSRNLSVNKKGGNVNKKHKGAIHISQTSQKRTK